MKTVSREYHLKSFAVERDADKRRIAVSVAFFIQFIDLEITSPHCVGFLAHAMNRRNLLVFAELSRLQQRLLYTKFI